MQLIALPIANRHDLTTFRERLQLFCDDGWTDLTSSLDGCCCQRLAQIIKRILLFIPLVFATVIEFLCKLADRFTATTEISNNNQLPSASPAPPPSSKSELAWSLYDEKKLLRAIKKRGNIQKIHDFFRARLGVQNKPRYFALTAVHEACRYGHLEALQALLEHEPDKSILHKGDYSRTTPLHVTTEGYGSERTRCLTFLLNNNVDIEARDTLENETPLTRIVRRFDKSTLEGMHILLQHVAKLHKGKVQEIIIQLTDNTIPRDLIAIINSYLISFECPDYVNMSEKNGKTPLFYMGFRFGLKEHNDEKRTASIEVTRLLLEAGASPLATMTSAIPAPVENTYNIVECEDGRYRAIETVAHYIRRTNNSDPANQTIVSMIDAAAAEWRNTELQAFYEARWARTAAGIPDARYYSPAPVIVEED